MKRIFAFLIIMLPARLITLAQIGIKAGYNFTHVTKVSSINSSNHSGFHAGILLSPGGKSMIGYRTELLFSKQGYNYKTSSNSGTVDLNYIMLQQGMCINISKYLSFFGGAQTAYLLNSKVDSNNINGDGLLYGNIMNLYNRFDYGLTAGVEIHPYKGLLIGAKYNLSCTKLYKDAQNRQMPAFSSQTLKNNLIQLYAGWLFRK